MLSRKFLRVIEELIVLYPYLVLAGIIYVTTWEISFAVKVGLVLGLTLTIPVVNWLVEQKAQEIDPSGEEQNAESCQIPCPVHYASPIFPEHKQALYDSECWPDMVTEVGNIYKKISLRRVKTVDEEIDRTIDKYKHYLSS